MTGKFTALATLIVLLFSTSVGEAASDPRATVTLTGSELRVSHIFSDAPSDAVIGSAPAPGRRQVLDLYALQQIARTHGIRWRARNAQIQTVVTRESRLVESSEIEETLRRELIARGLPQDRQIELSSGAFSIHVATNVVTPYTLENPVVDDRTGRASAILVVASEGAEKIRYRLDAYVYGVVEVPVLSRRVRRGETIEPEDVVWKKLRKESVGRNVIMDRDAVVGQAARRYLPSEQALLIGDVEAPKVVRKGSLVTVSFEARGLRLTAKAKATEDGAVNDTIRVVNIRSSRAIEAVVRSAGAVEIPNEKFASN